MTYCLSQQRFLQTQVHAMVLQATVQRALIYSPSADSADRRSFRQSLRAALEAVGDDYRSPVEDEDHVAHIVTLADDISRQHSTALRDGRFRIGPAQKALNLYLKYQWCLGNIVMPPHCPFDALVIGALPSAERRTWTQLDDAVTYRRLVRVARSVGGHQSLAEWELALYERLTSGSRSTLGEETPGQHSLAALPTRDLSASS